MTNLTWKKISRTAVSILLAAGLAACGSTSSSTASTTAAAESTAAAETTAAASATAAASTAASEETAAASAAEASASGTESSASEETSALETAFDGYMDAIASSVYPGSAGSTLNAAYQGADLLSWYVSNKADLSTDDIASWKADYVAGADDTFAKQLSAVASWISDADSEDSQGILGDSVWSGDITWSSEDCAALSGALA